ncbi:hypothetical protein Aph01nite_43880 [Acrocarpospora phusangensis]|uniref:Fibronectin type-III domain-containing protein n=1 Tax=Acrocarpospora phusangensis TaxID=1070424 RepID=A0A919QCC9_9ACTN|nr:fibronectin type III domain-containing protein [Acrocarpospora phusangensis]GIH26078.1 hypothetical protein Aph01nite_43880 [Acrocarpospora phusangensis]
MTVTEVKQGLGRWTIGLRPSIPREKLDALEFFGHIAVIEGRVNPVEYGDQLLSSARYVGVYRSRRNDVDNRTHNVDGKYELSGVGMAYWLGDEGGKGSVLESPTPFSGTAFAATVNALLPSAVHAGTLHTVAGTYSGTHQWVTRRNAIDYVCSTFGAEWRLNGDATLDAGTVAQLYPATPTAMLVKHGYGRDMAVTAYQGKLDTGEDAEEFSTRVVVLGRGSGESVATGAANVGANPYKDRWGNAVVVTRLVSESGTEATNAAARAQIELNAVSGTRRALRLASSDFDVSGTLRVGHWVWVYDPDTGLFDTLNEVQFRGDRINPAKYRCVELTWPVTETMTVAFRDGDGVWIDLTDHVVWESGDVSIVVGELPRSLTGGGVEQVGTRPSADTSTPAAPTWNTPFSTSTYPDALGITKAQILLSWDLPLNSDGSTILDGDHYEIAYGVHPASEWQTAYAAWGTLSLLVQELSPGVEYDIRIRAVDLYGHASAWSATEAVTVAPDSTPPSTPAAPSVAASRIAIQVSHTLGKASGGTYNLEVDLDHFEVHVGASSGFTPDSSTLKGKLPANVGMMLALVPAVGTFPVEETTARHVKVIAVDHAGNKSSASTSASATAQLIDDAHISDLTVSKVTAGTVSANWLLAASIRTAASGARVEVNASGVQAFTSGGVQTVDISNAGAFTLQSNSSGARIAIDTTNGIRAFNSGGVQTISITTGGVFTFQTGSSGARTVLDAAGFRTYNSSGAETVNIESANGNATIQGEVRSAVSGKRMVINPLGAPDSEVRFYPTTGSNYSFVNADDSGNHTSIRVKSSTTNAGPSGSNRAGELFLHPLLTELANGGGGATNPAELRMLPDGGISVNGFLNNDYSNAAFAVGSPIVSGTSGTIAYGITFTGTNPTMRVIATPQAGNGVPFSVNNPTTTGFSWLNGGPSFSGSDRVTYWALRIGP